MQLKPVFTLFSLAPRLVQLGSLTAFGLSLQGCVAAKHYEEARSVAETETAGHARTRARLEAASQRVQALEADLAQKEKSLADRESTLAESKLETTVAKKEMEAASQLVDQLRSELARTGDHLSSSSREKRDLQQTLLVAEQRMLGIETAQKNLGELVAATRDLALLLETSLEKGYVELSAKDGQVVLSVSAERVFAPSAEAVLAEATPLLEAVAKVSAQHPKLSLVVREPAGAELGVERARKLGHALSERGVPEARLTLPAAPASRASSEAGKSADSKPENAEKSGDDAAGTETAQKPAADAPAEGTGRALPAAGSLRYEIAFAP
jgi:flagellar motor protein MotB